MGFSWNVIEFFPCKFPSARKKYSSPPCPIISFNHGCAFADFMVFMHLYVDQLAFARSWPPLCPVPGFDNIFHFLHSLQHGLERRRNNITWSKREYFWETGKEYFPKVHCASIRHCHGWITRARTMCNTSVEFTRYFPGTMGYHGMYDDLYHVARCDRFLV